ncbi:hypothetical protein K8354_02665 [Polaribacter litorisediminis]|uniref:hypothetical protein n=1 Tax=Polaribacter litorisediminis TaxID=1908341 RepID=UPI001CBD6862|nr:hypothetical protein [Polaribacter litorisediminis]UAM98745.1 hypothetical protein K8354_02665 [Polaribacter litorisediminis]
MSKYGDIQYLIDRPEPTEIFLKAIQKTGFQLQEQFKAFNKEQVDSSFDGFKWVKSELTYPSFDNLSFSFKSSIYSVVIELIDETGSSFSFKQRERLLKACDDNNLIPCLFKIKLQEKSKNLIDFMASTNVEEPYELLPLQNGWNLFDARNNEKINPLTLSSEEPTEMSKWELSNFAIQIVRTDIENNGNEVLSFCDLPDMNPQIWFKDKKGNLGWVVVKHITEENDLDYRKWVGLEKNNEQLLPYDGYYAAVQFHSLNTDSMANLNRGDAFAVNYKGLERIYVC